MRWLTSSNVAAEGQQVFSELQRHHVAYACKGLESMMNSSPFVLFNSSRWTTRADSACSVHYNFPLVSRRTPGSPRRGVPSRRGCRDHSHVTGYMQAGYGGQILRWLP